MDDRHLPSYATGAAELREMSIAELHALLCSLKREAAAAAAAASDEELSGTAAAAAATDRIERVAHAFREKLFAWPVRPYEATGGNIVWEGHHQTGAVSEAGSVAATVAAGAVEGGEGQRWRFAQLRGLIRGRGRR